VLFAINPGALPILHTLDFRRFFVGDYANGFSLVFCFLHTPLTLLQAGCFFGIQFAGSYALVDSLLLVSLALVDTILCQHNSW